MLPLNLWYQTGDECWTQGLLWGSSIKPFSRFLATQQQMHQVSPSPSGKVNNASSRNILVPKWSQVFKQIKGVKKVRSAVHRRIWKHVKQIIVANFVFSMHKSFLVMLYSVCNHFWLCMISQINMFVGYCLSDALTKAAIFKKMWHLQYLSSFFNLAV